MYSIFGHHISIILEPRNSPYLDLELRLLGDTGTHVTKFKYILKEALEQCTSSEWLQCPTVLPSAQNQCSQLATLYPYLQKNPGQGRGLSTEPWLPSPWKCWWVPLGGLTHVNHLPPRWHLGTAQELYFLRTVWICLLCLVENKNKEFSHDIWDLALLISPETLTVSSCGPGSTLSLFHCWSMSSHSPPLITQTPPTSNSKSTNPGVVCLFWFF